MYRRSAQETYPGDISRRLIQETSFSAGDARAGDGLADPANWPAVLFFVAALIVLRLSLRLAGGAAGSRVLFLPRRLVTRLLVPALACTIAHAPYLDAAQSAAVSTYSAAASTTAAATVAALEHPRGAALASASSAALASASGHWQALAGHPHAVAAAARAGEARTATAAWLAAASAGAYAEASSQPYAAWAAEALTKARAHPHARRVLASPVRRTGLEPG